MSNNQATEETETSKEMLKVRVSTKFKAEVGAAAEYLGLNESSMTRLALRDFMDKRSSKAES